MIENDDQLGIVLAHEMAHSLLLHSVSNNLNIFDVNYSSYKIEVIGDFL